MPRPPSQPLLRAPRPTHPLAPQPEQAPATSFVPGPSPELDPLPRARAVLGDDRDPEPAQPPQPGDAPSGELRTFTTRLPVDLRRRLRRHAINTDQTLEQVARTMVSEYLDRHEADHV